MGQLCTELCEYKYMVILALGKWIRKVSYGDHEVGEEESGRSLAGSSLCGRFSP